MRKYNEAQKRALKQIPDGKWIYAHKLEGICSETLVALEKKGAIVSMAYPGTDLAYTRVVKIPNTIKK